MSEKLDGYFSVFNCHINDAHQRATADLEAVSPAWAKELSDWKDRGIMGIFDEKPTPATEKYVELVTKYVNEGK